MAESFQELDNYKILLVINCVMAAVLAILIACVVYLFFRMRQLNKLVSALDPMSKYKKVGPSIYIKRPQRDTSSISSSFKHFQTNPGKSNYPDDDVDVLSETFTEPNNVGTLDRNYFSRNKFNFENPLASNTIVDEEKYKDNREMRKLSNQRSQDAHKDVMDAIKSLDRVLY